MMDCSSSTASSGLPASCSGSLQVIRWISFTTSQIRGQSTTIMKRTGLAWRRATVLGFFLVLILGMVSPKMITRMVRIRVASQAYSSPPVIRITSTEARDEAPMLARLLPMRMALRASSKRSAIRRAREARLEPPSFMPSSRMVLQEE